MICEFKINSGETVRVTNLSVPNYKNEWKKFISDLDIENNDDIINFVSGDFNCIINKTLDRKPIPTRDDIGKIELETFLQRADLIDVWRKRNPNIKQYTFSRGNSHSRIDYLFVNNTFAYRFHNAKIVYFPFSDHDGVTLQLKLNQADRCPRIWKIEL